MFHLVKLVNHFVCNKICSNLILEGDDTHDVFKGKLAKEGAFDKKNTQSSEL